MISICFIYKPPEYSSYSRKLQDDILELIEKDISKYSNDGKIILTGDLNARGFTKFKPNIVVILVFQKFNTSS
jgi:hypothetical protein